MSPPNGRSRIVWTTVLTGLSPREADLTLYIMSGFPGYQELRERLGKHKTGKSCLYINRLNDIDLNALCRLVKESVAYVRRREKEQIG